MSASSSADYTRPVITRRERFWLAGCALAQGAVLFAFALARFENVHQRTFDLALYARIAYGLSRFDLHSPVLDTLPLGTHIAPILLPLGLVGRWLGTVQVLLFAQSACIALCVFPLARIGARHLGRRGVVLAAFALWLFPNIFHVATYEFHPGTLAMLPICWAFDALDVGDLKGLALSCLAILLCRESFGLTAAIFALLFYARERRPGALLLSLGCVAYTALALWVVLSHAPENSSAAQHFGTWGGSPLGVLGALVHDPARVLAHFSERERLAYLPTLLAAVAFLPLRAPWLLLPAAPDLTLNLLSTFPTTLQLYSHYLTPAVPALIVAALVGAAHLQRPAFSAICLVTLAIAHHVSGGSPLSLDFDRTAFTADDDTRAARAILAEIPREASVQAPDSLLPHLAERTALRRAPPPLSDSDWVVVDVSHRQRYARLEDLLRTSEEPFVRALLARRDHALVRYAPPYALFVRGPSPRSTGEGAACFSEARDPSQDVRLTDCLSVQDAEFVRGKLRLVLEAHGPCRPDLALRFGPQDNPFHVELLCNGKLSPARLRAGDVVEAIYPLYAHERAAAQAGELWVGAVRADGKTVRADDPLAQPVAVHGVHATN